MQRIYTGTLAGITTVLALALTVPACGDDESDSDGNTDAGMQNCAVAVTCDPMGALACQNDSDCPIVESGEARETASSCGQGCLSDADPVACSNACIEMESGLSAECSGCYTALIGCVFDNCLAECAAAPDSCACAQCQDEEGCRSAFDSCSGLEAEPL